MMMTWSSTTSWKKQTEHMNTKTINEMEKLKYPSKKELDDAIGYFVDAGFIQEMTTDKKHYTKILLQHAAKTLKQHIKFND